MQQFNFSTVGVDPSQAVSQFAGQMQNQSGNQLQNFQQSLGQAQQMQQYQYQLGVRQRIQELLPQAQTDANARMELLSLMQPEQAKAIQAEFQNQQKDQRDSTATIALQAVTAARGGQVDIAKGLLEERAKAFEAGGDTGSAARLRTMSAHLDDPTVLQTLETGALYASPDIYQNWLKQNALPSENKLREGQAAEANAGAGLKDAQATEYPSKIAQNEAQTRAYNAQAALDELKKTYAGTGQIADPAERAKAEADFRKEYSTQTTYFQQVRQYYANVLTSPAKDGATGASDISLVYNYMKMLDPGSVVREGEYATAQNSGGVPAQLLSTYNSIVNGQKLTPTQRQNMIDQAKTLYEQAHATEKQVRDGLTRIAKSRGLDPDNLFYQPTGASSPAAPGGNKIVVDW